jgi:hypothetical protein
MLIRSLLLGILGAAWVITPQAASSQSEAAAAAARSAADTTACRNIQPFYWEIGNRDGVLASGAAGDGSVTRDSVVAIASASKFVFGAYVIQRERGRIDANTAKFLHMSAGYTSLKALSCGRRVSTVQGCFEMEGNSGYSAANDNHFYYNGGHFQRWAVDHDLGTLDRADLAAEYRRVLGADIPFDFGVLQLAGGLRMSAAGYAVFLRRIVSGQLLFKDYLGADPVCTLARSCPGAALFSPIPVAWHYSYGHWVEDNPGGDGAFSSPGAFGFYPWIDASKTYYGMVSRAGRASRAEGPEGEGMGAGYASALCGEAIRRAFLGSR